MKYYWVKFKYLHYTDLDMGIDAFTGEKKSQYSIKEKTMVTPQHPFLLGKQCKYSVINNKNIDLIDWKEISKEDFDIWMENNK